MKELSSLDHVAYVRFASVYRSFQDVSEFTDMIAGFTKKIMSTRRDAFYMARALQLAKGRYTTDPNPRVAVYWSKMMWLSVKAGMLKRVLAMRKLKR